jgi:ATP-dependent DNA helicase DinG
VLNNETKERIQALYRECTQSLELKPRYGQRLMIAEIAKALGAISEDDKGLRCNDAGIAVVEAGTGTGKTLAYLLAALPIAIAKEKKLIVSTATVALQEQILDKDLPNLKKSISLPFNYALAKGRGRYLCLLKLDKALQHLSGVLSTIDLFEQTPEEQDRDLYEKLSSQYGSGQWDGDRDRLVENMTDEQWQLLTATHRECSGRRCPSYNNCAFYRARAAVEEADIVVANHDLVLADLSLGGGFVLPAPERAIYVFDEGHHLADKALNHFRWDIGVRAQRQWLQQLEKALKQFIEKVGMPGALAGTLARAPEQTAELLQGLSLVWPYLTDILGQDERHRFSEGKIPEALRELLTHIKAPLQLLLACLTALNELLQKALDPKNEGEVTKQQAETWHANFGLFLAHAENLNEALTWLCAQENKDDIPVARWLSYVAFGKNQDVCLSASPISVAGQLRKDLWWRAYGAVVTSATLMALNSFNKLSFDTGLPAWSHYQRVPSPFDYAQLGELEVVPVHYEPNHPEFQTELEQWLKARVNVAQATLVLFSSRLQLEATRDALIKDWFDVLLCQGFLAKAEIVRRHKERIDAGSGSVIFGLASFAEGIDLPGDYVRHVVIVKIPFAVPDDPIQAAISEWIEAQGRNPFMELTLPAASIRLIQACGRLIRTEQDHGRISILDNRLASKRYGSLLLDSLPPFKRI